jgi:tetratricopeptide (TPR) repeat protein
MGASPSFEIPIHPAWPSAPVSEFTKLPIERHFAQALEGVACPMFSFESSLLRSAPLLRLIALVISFGSAAILARTGLLYPRYFRLQRKGLDLLLAGQPAEAEQCYRTALAIGSSVPREDRVCLLVCLTDALFDQARYPESMQYLSDALKLGDPTGSGQGSMADLLIEQGTDPQQAIQMADKAFELITANRLFGNRWSDVSASYMEAECWARKTQALLQLERKAEARQAMDRALRIAEAADAAAAHTSPEASLVGKLAVGNRLQRVKTLTITFVHWRIGLALVAIGDTKKAAEHFRVARDHDPYGKYRQLAQKQLEALGSWAG